MGISASSDDPIRNFNRNEEEELTRNLLRLTQYISSLDSTVEYDLKFICDLHRQLFNGVRDHAGRIRNKDYGEEYLNFGPNRSTAGKDVPQSLQNHFLMAQSLFGQLDSLDKNLKFVEEVIKVAAYIHMELIRIHPFRDGNGRVSRLIMNFVLRKYNFPLLTVNIPRQEYIDCLNHYYKTREIEPLIELLIRVYYNQFFS